VDDVDDAVEEGADGRGEVGAGGEVAGCPADAVPQPAASSAIPEIAAASLILGVMIFATLSVGGWGSSQHSNEK
jgi:hypothetical protein